MLATIKISPLEYLGYPQFAATFALAVILHIMAGIGWYMSPPLKIVDIPVRTIDIRLGDSDVQQQAIADDEPAPQPELSTSQEVEDAMTKLIRHSAPEKVVKKPPAPHVSKPQDNSEKVPVKPPVPNERVDTPRQFVRFSASDPANKNKGSVIGNSNDSNAEVKARYEQTISLWIQKFKLYPDSARANSIQGKTIIRIRIDRFGNIRYSALEDTTGSNELDRAALDMVRRANPVPAVPDSYPGEMFEFLIPVKFQIQS